MIREATKTDKPEFLVMTKKFLKESKFPFSLDIELLSDNYDRALEADHFCVYILEEDGEPVGFIVGGATSPLFSSDLVATELGWYVDPQHRKGSGVVKLFQAYEEWAKKIGCKFVASGYVTDYKDLTKFYERRGFKLMEQTYVKEL